MSHKATNWLTGIRGLKPGEFVVLFHLCDCHNPSHGCFPSQKYLIEATGISNGSVNNHLTSLEEKGFIRRQQRRDADTKKRLSTRYILGFEYQEPSPDSGDGAISNFWEKPSPTFEKSHLQNLETKEVKVNQVKEEPVIKEDARANQFDIFWALYPNKTGKKPARKSFSKAIASASLSQIMDGLERYVNKNDYREWCHPATWLNQERWTDEPAQPVPKPKPSRQSPAALALEMVSKMKEDRLERERKTDSSNLIGFGGNSTGQ